MSDKQLSFSHKLAGVIERLIKTTAVKNIELKVFKGNKEIRTDIQTDIRREIPYIATDILSVNCDIKNKIIEVVGELNTAEVKTVALGNLETSVKYENLNIIHNIKISEMPLILKDNVEDFFEKFQISTKLKYKTKISDIGINKFKTRIINVNLLKFPRIIDNYYLIKRVPTVKSSANLSFLSQKEQLTYWRKAVLTTKKDPKHLELLGVYYKVPYYSIDKFNINYKKNKVSYKLKENASVKNLKVYDIILFRDIEEGKGIIIEN